MKYIVRYFLVDDRFEKDFFLCEQVMFMTPIIPQIKQTVDLWGIINIKVDDYNINYDNFIVNKIEYIYLSSEEMMIDIFITGNYFPE